MDLKAVVKFHTNHNNTNGNLNDYYAGVLVSQKSLNRKIYEDNAVALQAKSFEFSHINSYSRHNRKHETMRIYDTTQFRNNDQKPIFIVSRQKEIMNHKQKIVLPQNQIYKRMSRHLSQG
jgi:hypothetical protein